MTITPLDKIVAEAIEILRELGIPIDGETKNRQKRIAKAFIATCDLKPGDSWSLAKSVADEHMLGSRQVLKYMNEFLGEKISDSSYDDIRRKDLILPVKGNVILKAAKNANASTNDGTRKYAVSPEAVNAIRTFDTKEWQKSKEKWLLEVGSLAEKLEKQRQLALIPVKIKDGVELIFSAGEHNQLQKEIIEGFLSRFGFGSEVLYVGDTADKFLFLDDGRLEQLGFFKMAHEELPDVLAYSTEKDWLYLIEAVHSANPITELRKLTLEGLTKNVKSGIVYVTAFQDRATFRKFAKDIAWETEVWIADNPEHMIHFNGDKFLGPHT